MQSTTWRRLLSLFLVFGLIAAACGGDDDDDASSDDGATASDSADDGGDDEAAAGDDGDDDAAPAVECPSNLVIQTDWWPEIEHAGTYQLIGPNGTADPETFRYSGPIQPQYAVGGIETVEVRAGGDAVSFTPVTSVMYEDSDVTLGYVNTSDAMRDAGSNAVIGVAKTLELNPQMIMWDPAQFDVSDPADLAATEARALHFDGSSWVDFVVGQGFLTEDQLDPSYGGAPDQFIESNGGILQQGFATNEIYKYENDIEWKDGGPADVEFFLIHDLGFEDYPAMVSVRADKIDELSGCLTELVPMLSQAWVDFLNDPTPVGDALVQINETYDTYWRVSQGINERALELFADGIAVNGSDGTYCGFDEDRVSNLIEVLKPGFDATGIVYPDDVAASDLVDNRFCEGAPSL